MNTVLIVSKQAYRDITAGALPKRDTALGLYPLLNWRQAWNLVLDRFSST